MHALIWLEWVSFKLNPVIAFKLNVQPLGWLEPASICSNKNWLLPFFLQRSKTHIANVGGWIFMEKRSKIINQTKVKRPISIQTVYVSKQTAQMGSTRGFNYMRGFSTLDFSCRFKSKINFSAILHFQPHFWPVWSNFGSGFIRKLKLCSLRFNSTDVTKLSRFNST